jgi:hypothetical protein
MATQVAWGIEAPAVNSTALSVTARLSGSYSAAYGSWRVSRSGIGREIEGASAWGVANRVA